MLGKVCPVGGLSPVRGGALRVVRGVGCSCLLGGCFRSFGGVCRVGSFLLFCSFRAWFWFGGSWWPLGLCFLPFWPCFVGWCCSCLSCCSCSLWVVVCRFVGGCFCVSCWWLVSSFFSAVFLVGFGVVVVFSCFCFCRSGWCLSCFPCSCFFSALVFAFGSVGCLVSCWPCWCSSCWCCPCWSCSCSPFVFVGCSSLSWVVCFSSFFCSLAWVVVVLVWWGCSSSSVLVWCFVGAVGALWASFCVFGSFWLPPLVALSWGCLSPCLSSVACLPLCLGASGSRLSVWGFFPPFFYYNMAERGYNNKSRRDEGV